MKTGGKAMEKIIRAACLLCTAAAAQLPAGTCSPCTIEKLGTIDEHLVEATPVVFKGKLWLFQYMHSEYEGGAVKGPHFRFLDMSDLKTATPPFGKGFCFGSAFVDGDRMVVTAVSGDKKKFCMMESTDLANWTTPRTILEGKGWKGFNNSLCKAGDRYVIAFELGEPKDIVGRGFTMFFAESRDLREWKIIDGAIYGKTIYTGAPLLRYHGGWFYFFYLENCGRGCRMYRTRVARSRDLKNWNLSPWVVLAHGDDDRAPHPKARLSPELLAKLPSAANLNASDLDMCEYGDGLVCSYSWGNQLGDEFLALGEVPKTSEREFCESFFSADGTSPSICRIACGKHAPGAEWSRAECVEMERGKTYRLHGRIRSRKFECVNHADLGGPEMEVAYLSRDGKKIGRANTWCVTDTGGGWADVVALAELPAGAVRAEIRMCVPEYVRGAFDFEVASFAPYAMPTPPEPTASPCPAIDHEGRLLAGGKKTFPLGMYFENWDPFTVSNLDVFADSPFNCAIPYGFPTAAQMDLCAKRGIGVVYNANVYYGTRWAFGLVSSEAEEDAWVGKTVAAFKDHPALLGWYVNDEFGLNMLERLDRRYALLKRLDPAHPTWGVFMKPAFARHFGANLDVIGVDPYPIAEQGNKPQVDFSRCASEPCDALDASGRKRPLWSVIQAFDWKMYCPTAKNTRMPTETDLRTMTWQEIASGANGIFYLAFTSLSYSGNGGSFEKHWAALKRVAAEVRAKEELLLSDPGAAFDRPPPPLVVRTWKFRGGDVALVANSSHTNVSARIAFDACEPLDVSLGPLAHAFFDLSPRKGALVRRFGHVEQARRFVRELKKRNGGRLPNGGIVAEIEPGEIALAQAFTLTAEDSGMPGAPVVYRAARRGGTVLSGAWTPEWKAEGGLLTATLPDDVSPVPGFFGCALGNTWGEVRPLSLYASGRRLPLSRWPNEGLWSIGEDELRLGRYEPWHAGKNASTNGWFVCNAPRMEAWARERNLWAHGWWFYEWADTVSRVVAVDPAARRMRIDMQHVGFGINHFGRYCVLNAMSEIDMPGEWALDPEARRLYVKPPADGSVPAVARAPTVLLADGVHDVSLEGFVFECARGGGAVELTSCRDVHLRASTVRHVSGWGYRSKNCHGCRVEGCDFYDIGEGGVYVDGGDYKTLEAAGNVVDNCHITDYGRYIANYRPGISLNGVGNRATHNLVHHGDHQGIFFYGDNHYIGYNVLHDLCRATDDAGAIYTYVWEKGVHEGTVVEHNLINEVGRHPDCGCNNGVYLDNVTSGVTVRQNVIGRARHGIASNAARNKTIGNVCINVATPWTRGDASKLPAKVPSVDCVISNNVAVACGKPGYKATNTVAVALGGNLETLEDPGFRDYFNFDWDARPGSPLALAVGDLRMRDAGLRADRWRVSPPVKLGRGASRPRPFEGPSEGPEIRVDAGVDGELPSGLKRFADDFSHGEFAVWGKGRVIWTVIGGITTYASPEWKDYVLFFTPLYDTTGNFTFMGAVRPGVMTEYELVSIRGAEPLSGVPRGSVVANARKPHSIKLQFRKNVPVAVTYRARIPSKNGKMLK